MEPDDWSASVVSVFVFFGVWWACWHQLGGVGLFFGWLPAGLAALVWPFALALALAVGAVVLVAAIVLECAR